MKPIDTLNKAFDGLEADLADLLTRYRQLKREHLRLQVEVKTRRLVGNQMASLCLDIVEADPDHRRAADLHFAWNHIQSTKESE